MVAANKLILGLLLPNLCLARKGWAPKTMDTFIPWPEEAADLLNNTEAVLKDEAPKLFYLVTLPGKDNFVNLQEVAVRNSYQSDLFQLDVKYMMADGLDLGCRKTADGSTNNKGDARIKEHSMGKWGKDQHWCHTHCTHQGRYCPVMSHEALNEQTHHPGGDLVLEVLRRLCLGKLLPKGFADPYFFEYINDFNIQYKCMKEGRDMYTCSQEILTKRLRDFPTEEGSDFSKCVSEADSNIDTTNELLEDSLDFSHEMSTYIAEDLPVMEFEGVKYGEMMRADALQRKWCEHFKGDVKPISCYFCKGSSNMKNCLWYLKWNGEEFSLDNYKHEKKEQPAELVSQQEPEEEETKGEAPKHQPPAALIEEDLVKGSEYLLTAGFVLGVGGTALLWGLVELKRRRAVAEVAGELPVNGFRDDMRVV